MMIATNPFMPATYPATSLSTITQPRHYAEPSTTYAPEQRYSSPTHFSYQDNAVSSADYSSVFSPSQTTYAPVRSSSSYDYTNISPSYTDNSQSYADYSNNPVYNDYSQQNYPVTNVKYVVKAPQTTDIYTDNSNRQINNTYNTYYYMLDRMPVAQQDMGYYPPAMQGYSASPYGNGYTDYTGVAPASYGAGGYYQDMGYGSVGSTLPSGYLPQYDTTRGYGQYYPQAYYPPQVCPPKPQGSGIGAQLLSVLAGVLLSSLQGDTLATDAPSNSNSVNVTINNQLDNLQEQVAELKNARSTTTYSRKKRYYSNDEA
jgi:hypothetical protein